MDRPSEPKSAMLWARAPRSVAEAVAEAAREDRRKKSDVVLMAVEDWLERREKLEQARKALMEAMA